MIAQSLISKERKYIRSKSGTSLCVESKDIKKCVQYYVVNKMNLFDKGRENIVRLNIHSKEPFNQKVEYNVRTEYEMKVKKWISPYLGPFFVFFLHLLAEY